MGGLQAQSQTAILFTTVKRHFGRIDQHVFHTAWTIDGKFPDRFLIVHTSTCELKGRDEIPAECQD